MNVFTNSCGEPNFFLPVKPLGYLFRGKFLAYLKEAFAEGRLGFYGQLRELAHPARFEELVAPLKDKEWVVYAKPPFGGPEQVLRYLARYAHRVAISNERLLGLEEGRVAFPLAGFTRFAVWSLASSPACSCWFPPNLGAQPSFRGTRI